MNIICISKKIYIKIMKIQFISDIHLEFYGIIEDYRKFIIPSADILCLSGDIGNIKNTNYTLFLKWCSENFKKVFLISGNHEYYSYDSIEIINNNIQKIVDNYTNITFLNNKIEEYNGFTFIGCILWSLIPEYIEDYDLYIYNDFRKIKNFTRYKYNELHKKDLEFLRNSIKKYKNIICLTHHLPSLELINEKYKNYDNFMFASNLNNIIKDNIKLWICGHSHSHNYKIINNVICALNPYGYPRENKDLDSIRNRIIEI